MSAIGQNIRICSINVWGLQDAVKRRKIYLWLQENGFDIIFMQETHCMKEDVDKFNRDWCGDMYHSVSQSRHGRGVAIALSKRFNCNDVKCNTDNEGRRVLLNMEHDGNELSLVNVYAPNNKKDRKMFFLRCLKWIKKYNNAGSNIMLGGDMNCCINDNDRYPVTHLQDQSRKSLKELVDGLDMIDCWNDDEDGIEKYTWCSPDQNIKSRLDYVFIGKECVYQKHNIELKTVITSELGRRPTDHKAVHVTLVKEGRNRGPGYWKLNTEYLEQDQYVTGIHKVVENVLAEFECTNISRRIIWDILKLKVKEFSIRYCKLKACEKRCRIREVERRLKMLRNELSHTVCEERRILEEELDLLYTNKAKGAQVRSRAEWVEQGEKNNKFFLQLERSKQMANTIHCLRIGEKEEASSIDILKEISEFYSNLYKSVSINHEDIESYLNEVRLPQVLTDRQKTLCEGLPSEKEIVDVIESMKLGKAPGYDGLPIEFYKVFWEILKYPFISFVIESSIEGELSSSARHAVISLIYKKGDKKCLSNYRPISLTNTDYKIIAFVLARRLQRVLPYIINDDQTGYMKGRFIGNNVRIVLDIFEICEEENRPGALIMLDYQKAFDTVEWNFLFEALRKFNLGENFIRWVNILYTNPTFSVKNNGWISKKLTMSRGIRQGCPLCALLFIIAVEILGVQIRGNENIKGFRFGNKEHKLSQYADDGIIMVCDVLSILSVFDTVKCFSSVAGPQLNREKVEGIWLGSLKNTMPANFAGIKWTDEAVRCLGIYLGHNKTQCMIMNWENKLDKIKKMLDQWKRRNLTIFGKVVVIKTLILPIVIYCATLLRPPEGFVKNLNVLLKNFMCLKRYRLCINNIIGDIENGGIGFPDITSIFLSLKAAWVSRLLDTEKPCPCSNIANYWYNKIGFDVKTIVKCNFKTLKTFDVLQNISVFYQDIILAYNKCKTVRPMTECNTHEIVTDVIWGNERFKFKGKCLYIKNWIESGILYVNDILDGNGRIIRETVLIERLHNRSNWIAEYHMVKGVCKIVEKISSKLENTSVRIGDTIPRIFAMNKLNDVINKRTGFYYNILRNQSFKIPYMQTVWCKLLDLDYLLFQKSWSRIYVIKIKQMPIKKLAEFNYKLLAGILPCGQLLSKWIEDIPLSCTVCNIKEDLKHMLFEWKKAKDIWSQISSILRVNIQWKHVVIGYSQEQNNTTRTLNWICCLAAYSIFKSNNQCKWNHLNYNECDVKKRVVNDLIFFKKMQFYFEQTYIPVETLENIIQVLSSQH